MYGTKIIEGPKDWEILQQENGKAEIVLKGNYRIHPEWKLDGVISVQPVVRILREKDNFCIIPWMKMEYQEDGKFTGTYSHKFSLMEGGPYRIETSLRAELKNYEQVWFYRGDNIFHVGVGNLFLIAGQSNSAGYSKDYVDDAPQFGVHLYRNCGKWELAVHPMNDCTGADGLPNEEKGLAGISPYLAFGKQFQEFSHCPVGLVQTALGGSFLKEWIPPNGVLYQNLMDRIQRTKGKYTGILWYQGCSDATPQEAPLYYDRFCFLVETIRQQIGYEIPFFTFQLNRVVSISDDKSWGVVREAQRQAAENIQGIYILPTTDCTLYDEIHNSAGANIILGKRMAKLAGYILLKMPCFLAPVLEKVTLISERVIAMDFGNVEQGFIIRSRKGTECGFTLEDENGLIEIQKLYYNQHERQRIYLLCERELKGEVFLSFCWEANPTIFMPIEERSCLPPISFYRYSILK